MSERQRALGDELFGTPMGLVKTKQRVADHGEVFTPPWMVEAMLDLVKPETEQIDARFLEPACGSGYFLVRILRRKLTVARDTLLPKLMSAEVSVRDAERAVEAVG